MLKFLIIFLLCIHNICISFDYERETHAKRKIIKSFPISENEKYISFILEGTWTDNLGNYGLIEQASFVFLKNNEETYFRGYRNRQEKDAGVGQTEVLNSTETLKPLIGMICPYAVKFFKETAYAFSKCKITENQKKVLSNISQE